MRVRDKIGVVGYLLRFGRKWKEWLDGDRVMSRCEEGFILAYGPEDRI